jgi:hypothetical protein
MMLRFPPNAQVQTKGNSGGAFTQQGHRGKVRGRHGEKGVHPSTCNRGGG